MKQYEPDKESGSTSFVAQSELIFLFRDTSADTFASTIEAFGGIGVAVPGVKIVYSFGREPLLLFGSSSI